MILFFYLCAEQGTIGWLITYFKDTGILPKEYSQITSSIQWIMILIGRLLVAYCGAKYSLRYIYRIMGIGFVMFFLLLIFANNPIIILIGIAGFGFSMAGIYPTTVALAGDVIKKYELSWSFILTFASLGSIIMPTIIGIVSDNFGVHIGMSTIAIVTFLDFLLILYRSKSIKK